jgi:linoleoyl-CoA desaturase
VVEETQLVPSQGRTAKYSWAAHQLHTTANFATDNALARFLCGGLTHQIEHHLFPQVCHVHYPALSKIVQQVAREHGLPYHSTPTFFGALGSHVRQMEYCGRATEPMSRTASAA